jgi:hypothetical protein
MFQDHFFACEAKFQKNYNSISDYISSVLYSKSSNGIKIPKSEYYKIVREYYSNNMVDSELIDFDFNESDMSICCNNCYTCCIFIGVIFPISEKYKQELKKSNKLVCGLLTIKSEKDTFVIETRDEKSFDINTLVKNSLEFELKNNNLHRVCCV